MKITVMTADEQTITLDVDPHESVKNVKALLEVETSVPLQQQQLLFNGREVSNSEKLSALGVKDDDLLMMVSGAGPANAASSGSTNDWSLNADGSAVNPGAFQQHIRRDSKSTGKHFQVVSALTMEALVKKFQSKFKKIKEEMNRWDELQSCLISQFRNASHIVDRLQVLQNSNNYDVLNCVSGMRDALLIKQIESLRNILVSMRKTLEEFHCIVLSLHKIHRDSRQLVNGGSCHLNVKQLQQQVGIKPSLMYCLDSLMFIHEIYNSEYLLKSSVISALSEMALKPSASDLGALQQLLVDQPNLQTEEVQFVFDVIFAEELS